MGAFEYYGKSKLPRGFSYPLSYSVIATLIQSGAFPCISGLAFIRAENEGLISAHYSGPRAINEAPSLTLWINAVPSMLRKRMNELLITQGLPLLSRWAIQYTDRTLAVSQSDHRYRISYHHLAEDCQVKAENCHLVFDEDGSYLWNNRW